MTVDPGTAAHGAAGRRRCRARSAGSSTSAPANASSSTAGELVDGGGEVVLDLCELTFCDSTGLAVLVRLHKRAEAAGGTLVLRVAGPARAQPADPHGSDPVVPRRVAGMVRTFERSGAWGSRPGRCVPLVPGAVIARPRSTRVSAWRCCSPRSSRRAGWAGSPPGPPPRCSPRSSTICSGSVHAGRQTRRAAPDRVRSRPPR